MRKSKMKEKDVIDAMKKDKIPNVESRNYLKVKREYLEEFV